MKRIFAAICVILLASVVGFAQSGEMTKKSDKKSEKSEKSEKSDKKSEKKKEAAPASDTDIQKCITDKLAATEKLKSQGFSATVSSGVATLTGNAANPGSKGAATNIAKKCGAKSVTNDITVTSAAAPAPK